jgi:uncharacterized protein
MKISGSATLHAPPPQVWAALTDPAVLAATIPGCERLEATGPDQYALTVTAGVASVRGTYAGQVALSDQHEPEALVLTASGSGAPGTIATTVQVRLAGRGDGQTELSYDADAQVGGVIAGVGQRMLASVAKRTAGEFFTAVNEALDGQKAGTGSAGSAAAAAAPAAETAGAGAAAAGAGGAAGPAVWAGRAAAASRPGHGGGFLTGVLTGAAVALAGVAVGAWLGRRAR